MAREVAPPIEAPSFSFETWREDEEQYLRRCRAAARAANKGDLVGETVKWQRGDGYAVYMVWSERPLELFHIALGDAWTAEPSLIRGLRRDDVLQQVEWERRWKKASTEPNDVFYGSVKPDDIVHYSNGSGQYIRCKVVSDPTGIQGVKLLPIALVGGLRRKLPSGVWVGWFEHDVVTRDVEGDPHYGYHAKQIVEEERFQPHASNIYEYEGFNDRIDFDPRSQEAMDLTPPPLTEEQQRTAPLASAMRRIRSWADRADLRDEASLREALGWIAATALNELDRKE